MKKLIAGLGALMLAGQAGAATIDHVRGSDIFDLESVGLISSPLMTPSDWQRALVEAGLRHAAENGQQQWNGMGGPEEEIAMWPACRPGPGDDRCIQLYERGVRRALAQWTSSRSKTAMGGPYEAATMKQMAPVSASVSGMRLTAKNPALQPMELSRGAPDAGDKSAPMMEHPPLDHSAIGHGTGGQQTGALGASDGGMSAEQMRGNSAWAQHGGMGSYSTLASSYTGMGGPEEDEAGRLYPRCRSRSDDRCQQGR